MARATTMADAQALGFTVPYFAESDCHCVDILVRDGTDLDDAFLAFVPDWSETIRINGWMWCIEPIAADMLEV